jgi:hypothetical protein
MDLNCSVALIVDGRMIRPDERVTEGESESLKWSCIPWATSVTVVVIEDSNVLFDPRCAQAIRRFTIGPIPSGRDYLNVTASIYRGSMSLLVGWQEQ